MKKTITILILIAMLFSIGCVRSNNPVRSMDSLSVLVFITGMIAGSPPYELLVEGANEFARFNPNVSIKIYEAGINQATWEEQLGEMVSSGEYDIVISSNPSLPEICARVSRLFPGTKFIITDAHYEGNENIKTYLYNQYEQSLFLGYLAGLITTSDMPFVNNHKKIGFLAAQEFPLLMGHMVPGFLEGARLVDPDIELDFREIGSWVDANKASELTLAMISSGVDVFTSIAGGAAHGMIKTVSENNAYIVWYNTDSYHFTQGNIVGCGKMEQKKLVMEILDDVLKGKIQYGISDVLGVKNGYLNFVFDNPVYQNLPIDIRENFETFFNSYFMQ